MKRDLHLLLETELTEFNAEADPPFLLHSGTEQSRKKFLMKMKLSKKSGTTRPTGSSRGARLKIRNILATTDLSNESIAGVRYAVALAEMIGGVVDSHTSL